MTTLTGPPGATWEQVFHIVGTEALTDWTQGVGSWAANAGGYWEVTATGRSVLYYTPLIAMYNIIFEAETYNPSGGSGTTRVGIGRADPDYVYQPLVYHTTPSGSAGPTVASATTTFQDFGNSGSPAFDTWTKLRGVFAGGFVTSYVDGTCRGSAYAGADYRGSQRVCLWTQDGRARFRNIKLWTLTGGLPA